MMAKRLVQEGGEFDGEFPRGRLFEAQNCRAAPRVPRLHQCDAKHRLVVSRVGCFGQSTLS